MDDRDGILMIASLLKKRSSDQRQAAPERAFEQQIVDKYGDADQSLEALPAFGETAFRGPRNNTDMRPSMPARKR
jgi:hypothetical protein